jgi:hypothetical protein
VPERLRLRVVALVSAVLPSISPVPPALRKVASFAPARRARLGGGAIWAALDDDNFREHAAVQVAAVQASVDDPVDTAARAWLARDDGWEADVAEVAESLEVDVARSSSARCSARTAMPAPRGVRVVFSPEGVIADDVIRQLVEAEPRGRVVVVVSDDQAVARDIVRAGARSVPTPALLGVIGS